MTRVVWTPVAREELAEIRSYIARDSGRLVPELEQPMLREIIVGSYRIVYRVISDQVQILTVVHGARRFPTSELRGTK